MSRTRNHRWKTALPLAVAAALIGLTGCQGGGTPAATSDAPVDSGARAAAQEVVAEFSAAQAPLEVAPLDGEPAKGLTLGVVACEFPACVKTVDGARAAADALGWTTKVYTTEISPEAYAEAWGRMMADSPDVIIFNGIMPNETIQNYLDEAKAAGIPMAAIASSNPPDDIVPASTVSAAQLAESGRLMGASIAADSEGQPEVLFVWDPAQIKIFGPVKDAIEQQLGEVGGSMSTVDVQSSEIGKGVPTAVTSAVQANPDVKYVAFAIADFTAGVPEALANIGADVKLITRSPGEGNLQNIVDGIEWVGVAEESVAGGWAAMDAVLRQMAGQEFDPDPVGWHQIYNADNIDTGDLAANLDTPGIPQSYLEAWGIQ